MATSVVIPQCDSAINQTILTAATYTSSDTAGPWPVDFWSSAEITVVVTTNSATLDVYLQKLLPDDTTWDDIAHPTQWAAVVFTTTGTQTISFVNGGNTINTQTDAALAASTIRTVHFGNYWRIKYVITGTSSVFGVYGSFKR